MSATPRILVIDLKIRNFLLYSCPLNAITYIFNTHGLDVPIGNNYHKFGWQEDHIKIPRKVKYYLKKKMEARKEIIRCGHWVAEEWN